MPIVTSTLGKKNYCQKCLLTLSLVTWPLPSLRRRTRGRLFVNSDPRCTFLPSNTDCFFKTMQCINWRIFLLVTPFVWPLIPRNVPVFRKEKHTQWVQLDTFLTHLGRIIALKQTPCNMFLSHISNNFTALLGTSTQKNSKTIIVKSELEVIFSVHLQSLASKIFFH